MNARELQRRIQDAASREGWKVTIYPPGAGVADMVLMRGNRVIYAFAHPDVRLNRPHAGLTGLQWRQAKRLSKRPDIEVCAWGPNDWAAIREELDLQEDSHDPARRDRPPEGSA